MIPQRHRHAVLDSLVRRRAGKRAKASETQFLANRLRLKVNESKNAVARPSEREFLGFTFTNQRQPKRWIAPQALKRFAVRIREITRRTRGVKVEKVIEDLCAYPRSGRSASLTDQPPSDWSQKPQRNGGS